MQYSRGFSHPECDLASPTDGIKYYKNGVLALGGPDCTVKHSEIVKIRKKSAKNMKKSDPENL